MLKDLYAGALADSERRKELVPSAALGKIIDSLQEPLDFAGNLRMRPGIAVIAEIKRASPSKGMLTEIVNPDELANTYQESGAAAISVLTEERKFLGSLDDFDRVRRKVSLPLLRKDFIATEYQILEARAHSADAVLLIVAGLEFNLLKSLKEFIESFGMTALVETHNTEEVRKARDIGAQVVGINARDLNTFEINRDLFAQLSELLPDQSVKVAESAVRTSEDVRQYAAAGADAVLVGEALVTGDAASLIRSFSNISRV